LQTSAKSQIAWHL